MSNKIDNYNRVIDFIGNVIKATSDPNGHEDLDKALDIAHTVGNVIETVTDNNNTVPQHGNDTK